MIERVALRIDAAQVQGVIRYRPLLGLSVDDGRIEGYLTRASLIDMVRQLQMVCGVPTPPASCASLALFIAPGLPPERGADTIAAFVGGYEARFDDDGPGRCDPMAADDCNAVGVCLLFEATPATLDGVAD